MKLAVLLVIALFIILPQSAVSAQEPPKVRVCVTLIAVFDGIGVDYAAQWNWIDPSYALTSKSVLLDWRFEDVNKVTEYVEGFIIVTFSQKYCGYH